MNKLTFWKVNITTRHARAWFLTRAPKWLAESMNYSPIMVRTALPRTWIQSLPALCLSLCILAGPAVETGMAQQEVTADLSNASLEDLMNVKVTSVSRKEQRLSKVAAAIYVITQEDIRRSGASNIPDLLRIVPGLDVAQINSNTWAISARGFNGQFANKMLVLIDGRTVYDPSNSGVYWDAQDLVMEDIERIEVIRGPGASIWGTNAVNGVINIITKNSNDTQGGLLTAGGGSTEPESGTLRYGGKLGRRTAYRVFGKYFNRGSFRDAFSSRDAADGWYMKHAGFRMDSQISDRDSLTFQGDIYGGIKGEPLRGGTLLTPPFTTGPYTSIKDYAGGNLLTRWNHTLSGGSEMTLQVYFDRISRVDPQDPELRSTFDFDFEHHVRAGERHDIVWGGGYRNNSDVLTNSFAVSFNPPAFRSAVENVFFQDEINLVRDKLWFTVGLKVEHNEFSGYEPQPTVRALWTPNSRNTLWAAYSHSDRIPARNDRGLRVNVAAFPIPPAGVGLLSLMGNPSLKSEELDAYELGYRIAPDKRLSFDVATFYNVYQDLRTSEPNPPFLEASPAPLHVVIPLVFDNKMSGRTYGAEASVEWKATNFWALQGGYTWLVPKLALDASSRDATSVHEGEGVAPRNQLQVQSKLNLRRRLEFDTALYRVGYLAEGKIPAYLRLDARLGWHIAERLEVSLVGQNLLDPRHPEFF